jgi:hypothetical protein
MFLISKETCQPWREYNSEYNCFAKKVFTLLVHRHSFPRKCELIITYIMAVLSPLYVKPTMISLHWNASFTFLFFLLCPASFKKNDATSMCETHEIIMGRKWKVYLSHPTLLCLLDMVKGWSHISATFAFHFNVLSTLWGHRELFNLRASPY